MKKMTVALLALCSVSACASFKPDYEVKDASESSRPAWTVQNKAYKSDDSDAKNTHRFFVEDAENVNQRLCLKSAEARATQKVASEIAQELIAKYEEKTQSKNDKATAQAKDNLQQSIKVNLHGVAVQGKYWEKRRYLKELGAEKDLTAYHCDVVVKISNAALAEALQAYKDKTMKTLKGEDKQAMEEVVTEAIDELLEE